MHENIGLSDNAHCGALRHLTRPLDTVIKSKFPCDSLPALGFRTASEYCNDGWRIVTVPKRIIPQTFKHIKKNWESLASYMLATPNNP